MRYRIGIELDSDRIPKDKNRMILSFIKKFTESSDKEYYKKYFDRNSTERKKYTFSLYMPNSTFEKNTILIPDKMLFLDFSTSDLLHGIQFYNAMTLGKNKSYKYKEITLKILTVHMIREKIVTRDTAILKTLSPIVVREHDKSKNKDWYHNLDSERGRGVFLENLKYQLLNEIPESKFDLDEIEFEFIWNKKTVVRNYGIDVESNLCKFKIDAKAYIINHLYKSGIGSHKSTGFGMLEII